MVRINGYQAEFPATHQTTQCDSTKCYRDIIKTGTSLKYPAGAGFTKSLQRCVVFLSNLQFYLSLTSLRPPLVKQSFHTSQHFIARSCRFYLLFSSLSSLFRPFSDNIRTVSGVRYRSNAEQLSNN